MPSDDLKEHATTAVVDYYDLLEITFETSESDIRRAYRRAALKYHPDKNAGKPDVIEKFHLLQIAYDVLSDPTYKAMYDNTRRAKKEKEERERAITGRRKEMIDDLERRERRASKRKFEEEAEDAEEAKRQRELQKLAADGKRRRLERQEKLARERLEEEERLDRESNGYVDDKNSQQPAAPAPKGGTSVPEIDRSVKVVWSMEGKGEAINKERLTQLFEPFGKIESVFLLSPKKKKLGDSKSKALVTTGVIVYLSIVGAYAAIEEVKKRSDEDDYQLLHSVYWASNKEPECLNPPYGQNQYGPNAEEVVLIRLRNAERKRLEEQRRKEAESAETDAPATPLKAEGVRKAPSFASFSPGLFKTPTTASKEMERKRLEEQIRKQDAEEDAAKAV